jgi:hypothetical protein
MKNSFKNLAPGDWINISLAFITFLAVCVALWGTLLNSGYSQRQLSFLESETRPFVHTKIAIPFSESSTIFLINENDGNIPALLMYQAQDARLFYNESSTALVDFGLIHSNESTPIAIYSGESPSGIAYPSPILKDQAMLGLITKNLATLVIANCILYKPIEQNDFREWEIDQLWSASINTNSLLLSSEQVTASSTCDPQYLFSRYKN